MKRLCMVASLLLAAPGAALAQYEPSLGLAARVGTLGLSLEATTGITERFNMRAGINQYDYDYDPEPEDGDSGNDLTYGGTLDLSSLSVFADWHPWAGGFRVSGGVIFNGNEIGASARCEQASCEVGDQSFDAEDIGTIRGLIDFNSVAPYAGIGWGNAVAADTGFGFQFDIGVMLQGSPNVSLTADGSCNGTQGSINQQQCEDDLNQALSEEAAELESDTEDFDLYPVISLGIRYKFL